MDGLKNYNAKPWVNLLIVVAVVQIVAIAWLVMGNRRLDNEVKQTKDAVSQAEENLETEIRGVNGDIAYSAVIQNVIITPTGDEVLIPEFRIKLPLTDLSKSIAYSIRGELDVDAESEFEADIESTHFLFNDVDTVRSCTHLVRIKIEDKQRPANPNEKPTTVNLVDGRKLQIYELSDIDECEEDWSGLISPKNMAAEFKNAQSY